MKYLCVKSVRNESVENGELSWVETFTEGNVYDYAGHGVMNNNLNEPHQVSFWFKFWHFSKATRKDRARIIEQKIREAQELLALSGMDEDKYLPLSRLLADARSEATSLRW